MYRHKSRSYPCKPASRRDADRRDQGDHTEGQQAAGFAYRSEPDRQCVAVWLHDAELSTCQAAVELGGVDDELVRRERVDPAAEGRDRPGVGQIGVEVVHRAVRIREGEGYDPNREAIR